MIYQIYLCSEKCAKVLEERREVMAYEEVAPDIYVQGKYTIDLRNPSCTCMAWTIHGGICKHIRRAREVSVKRGSA
jgi:hypothetical protein